MNTYSMPYVIKVCLLVFDLEMPLNFSWTIFHSYHGVYNIAAPMRVRSRNSIRHERDEKGILQVIPILVRCHISVRGSSGPVLG